ncbi:MAG: 3-dehydroquinate synthase, partial [Clostridia bacterium]|nr:3-dehydroquinate synthase [Clostridia bacterium]
MKIINLTYPSPSEVVVTSDWEQFDIKANAVFAKSKKLLVVTDGKLFGIHKKLFDGFFPDKQVYYFRVPRGEGGKDFTVYYDLNELAFQKKFSRFDGVIAFGGGSVGDIAGFFASTYKRGLTFVNVPTTVLSMADASVGGKTAINFNGVKNVIGTFYQPKLTFINVELIKTLDEKNYKNGYGEIVKYCFLDGKVNAIDLNKAFDEDFAYRCLKIKSGLVEKDFFDQGERNLLNLGHTFGHAIERLSRFRLSHGECVVCGLYLSLVASKNLGVMSDKAFERAEQILTESGFSYKPPYALNRIIKQLETDKKFDG